MTLPAESDPLSLAAGALRAGADLVDQDITLSTQKLNLSPDKIILSFHSGVRMRVEDAFEVWSVHCRNGEGIKHIEPFVPECEKRWKQLRRKLWTLSDRLTVLPMGQGSSKARRELAWDNALHYCALNNKDASAPGQALIAGERKYFEFGLHSIARAGN